MTAKTYDNVDFLVITMLAWLLTFMIVTGRPFDPGRWVSFVEGLYHVVIVGGFIIALIIALVYTGQFVKRTLEDEGDE